MIPRLHKRGTSFKGACGYILHDAQKTSRERVLWSETHNLISKADDAWFEMFATARDQAALKEQAGQSARGRKNTNPVLHLTLSWAIGENPTQQHMLETARTALSAIGLGEHQALISAHNDKEHLHVHMVVNSIHPVTGMTAGLKYTKEKLSRWAEAYEKTHGIHCEQRLINNEERAQQTEREPPRHATAFEMMPPTPPPTPEKPKQRSPHRQRHLAKTEVLRRMTRYRAEYEHRHMVERDITWSRHRQEYAELSASMKQTTTAAQQHVEQDFKPHWRVLYSEQRQEARQVEKTCTHVFERAVYVFRNSERLGASKPMSLGRKIQLICSPAKLMKAVENMHARERKMLAQVVKVATAERLEQVWKHHQPRFENLLAQQTNERLAQRAEQDRRANDGVSYLRARNELTLERRHGHAPRMAAGAPVNENDASYISRMKAETKAFYERQRAAADPKRVALSRVPKEQAPTTAAFNASVTPPDQQKHPVEAIRDQMAELRRLSANMPVTDSPPANRVDLIKKQMAEWRRLNPGRDTGREM